MTDEQIEEMKKNLNIYIDQLISDSRDFKWINVNMTSIIMTPTGRKWVVRNLFDAEGTGLDPSQIYLREMRENNE